jgi:hypothetical protein
MHLQRANNHRKMPIGYCSLQETENYQSSVTEIIS